MQHRNPQQYTHEYPIPHLFALLCLQAVFLCLRLSISETTQN